MRLMDNVLDEPLVGTRCKTERSTNQTNPDTKIHIGVDLAREGGDRTVGKTAKKNKLRQINITSATLYNFQAMTDKLMVTHHHPIDPIIEHSIDGICSEAGELADAAKRVKWYGTDIDITNILEECGDILFYLDKLVRKCDSSFEEVMQMNMKKLAKRYKDHEFTKDQAVNRDTDAERKILEGEPDHKIDPIPTCSNCVKSYRLKPCKDAKVASSCSDHEFIGSDDCRLCESADSRCGYRENDITCIEFKRKK